MVFLGVYRAIYDYAPQSEGELLITEGDLIFVLEKDVDGDWWRAKRKATDDEEEEPEGLIPSNYIEEAQATSNARALYDYSRQTDEEISFSEDAPLLVYDETDPDWTLVGYSGEFGFAPSNYIDKSGARPDVSSNGAIPGEDDYGQESPVNSPAAALAGLIQQRTGGAGPSSASVMSPPRASTYTPDASDEDDGPPSLPSRPQMSSAPSADKSLPRAPGIMSSPQDQHTDAAPGQGFRMYLIHEMASHMGRNRKMPTALGLDVSTGLITISPESDGPPLEWTAEKLTHYSLEGKHVFVELIRPSKSIDFHAGNKETAGEIVSALGELAGAARAEGLREVLAISNSARGGGGSGGQKRGQMLYEFMAQGEDEVTVAAGDEVIILDDTASDDWWRVRRVKTGKEGVAPREFIELLGSAAVTPTVTGAGGGYSVEQNRRDEERMTREVVRLPSQQESSKRERRKDSRVASGGSKSTPTPNNSKLRQWTDRSGSFKVDAEFLGVKDGKIHLHKTNGVKIAVPAAKMSPEDINYVERETGMAMGGDSSGRQTEERRPERPTASQPPAGRAGAVIQQSDRPQKDWFEFFLECGVAPQICERYSAAFQRDQITEDTLQDIDAGVLRTLGFKEGDILRVTKTLDTKFGRQRPQLGSTPSASGRDGLFSGPDGGLKNNTAKGRPAPPVETNNTVDPSVFEQKKSQPVEGATATPLTSAPSRQPQAKPQGFDDDAWDNKPTAPPAQPQRPVPTGAMSELSLLSPPLQPSPAPQPPQQSQSTQPLQPQATGADRSFFNQLAQQTQRPQPTTQMPNQSMMLSQRPMSAPNNQAFQLQQPLRPQVTGIAPPGQSMNDMVNNQRMQQLYPQQTGYGFAQPNGLQPQQTGYVNGMQPQQTGYANFMPPQQTGYPQQQQQQQFIPTQPTGFIPQPTSFQQPYLTAQQTGSPFADPPRAPFVPQPTGYAQQPYGFQPQQTGINNYMPLAPQRTGILNGLGQPLNGFGQPPSQLPALGQQNQQLAAQPLVPQKTGPAPPIRFGVQPAQKLTPQMTGRRANLSQATPQNPFGF